MLLVTGAYAPEISAAGVQCRAVAAALAGRVRFLVLTTAVDATLPASDSIDGVVVHRVAVDVRSGFSKAAAGLRFAVQILRASRSCDIIHIHGFSQKSVPAALLARLAGTPVVLTLHTAGQDEPQAVRRRGWLAYHAFQSADLLLCVSPYLSARCEEAGVAPPVRVTPNGVDTDRFRPADSGERSALGRRFGWPDAQPVVLFVGFFSHDKRPDLLFRAWCRVRAAGVAATLVFVGAKGSGYYEIDESIARRIQTDAAGLGLGADVKFADPTNEVEQYFRAADVFVLPSIREGHPLALLEAMASGLPAVASRLPGATDAVIDDGRDGRLLPPDDEAALAEALRDVLTDQQAARLMGARARETVMARYDIRHTAEQWLAAYQTVLTNR